MTAPTPPPPTPQASPGGLVAEWEYRAVPTNSGEDHRLLAECLSQGWEPFGVTAGTLHLRRDAGPFLHVEPGPREAAGFTVVYHGRVVGVGDWRGYRLSAPELGIPLVEVDTRNKCVGTWPPQQRIERQITGIANPRAALAAVVAMQANLRRNREQTDHASVPWPPEGWKK